MLKTVVVVLVVAAACGKKSEQSEPNKSPGSAAAATTKFDLAALLAGSKGPTLIGPYAKARFGMTKEELSAVVPGYADYFERKPSQRDPDGAYYAWFDQTDANRGLEMVVVHLPEAQIGEVEKAWGKGEHFEVYGEGYDVWLDREARIRVHLNRSPAKEPRLEIMRYQPLDETLGAPGPRFSTETKHPFLGSTPDELAADYPTQIHRANFQVGINFLADEYDTSNLFNITLLAPDNEKTTALVYTVVHGNNPKVKEERLAKLVAKYGAAKEEGGVMVLGKNTPEVVVIDKEGTWTVESPRR